MVKFTSFITAAFVISTFAVALPTRDELPQQGNYGYGSGSKDSSSNSGYQQSSNGYGESNNSGYASSQNSNGKGSSYEPPMKATKTTEQVMTTTSTSAMSDTTTESAMSDTMTQSYAMTTESPAATSSVMYGSGSMSYGSGYNDCVQQCIAQFPPSGTGINSGSDGNGGSAGSGATKTVIVAPSQGVLRYVPFAVNASVGDTIKFVWKANKHTVSQGSAPLPCNQTSGGFTTDIENMGFTFTQVVNSTDPVFFFCAAPGHCQKGMFGVINMASNMNAPTSASGMMQSLKANNSDLKTYAAVVDKATINTPAYTWGGNLDMANVPDWAQPLAAENILYTRSFLASNPELIGDDGTVDMSSAETTPLMYPLDMQDAIKNAATSTPSNPPADPAGAAATSSASTPVESGKTSGATSNIPRAVTAIAVALATLLIL